MADESPQQPPRRRLSGLSADRVHKSPPTSHASQSGNGSGSLNPRSCVTCRRRKVKCDKKHPCTNCTKAHVDCVYPSPGRAPRRARKPPDGELMERLRRLEGVVQSLGVQVEDEPDTQVKESPQQEMPTELTDDEIIRRGRELKLQRWKQMQDEAAKDPLAGLDERFGRLVVDEGRSRYISNSFWANLNNEVEDVKGILNDSSDEEEDYPSPDTSDFASSHQSYVFGYRSTNVDMSSLHPSPEKFELLWAIYKENVDPIVKVLHIPTIEPTILGAKSRLDKIHKGLEALLFAVYYAAATSLLAEECREQLGEDKDELIQRYRFGVEQALARANFLSSDELIVLSAFVIFLICLRRNDHPRVIWTLTGLVVRMAQTLGIHRDGTNFNLSPFDTEMRRRLWWQVCILEARASEDQGCDPTVTEQSFDTQMPLNVNDADLDPSMKEFPPSRVGCTEMTFGLIRFEVTSTLRRLQYTPPGPNHCKEFFCAVTMQKKEQWITECHQRLEERYLRDTDLSVPLFWVIATVSRLIMSKMWLLIYHPFQRLDGGATLPQETKDKLFLTSLENIEYSILLETEARTRKWGWLFRTYVQWHAIAFLLTELCARTHGDLVDRAWRAIEAMMANRLGSSATDETTWAKGHLWRPLRRLMARARAARAAALADQRALLLSLAASEPLGWDMALDAQYPLHVRDDDGADADAAAYMWHSPGSAASGAAPDASNTPNAAVAAVAAAAASSSRGSQFAQAAMSPPAPDPSPLAAAASQFPAAPPPPLQQQQQQQTDMGLDFFLADQSFAAAPPAAAAPADDALNWANWDDMVREFEMQLDQAQDQPVNYGPGFGGPQIWY